MMMTPVRMWSFLLLAAFLLIVPTIAEVVENISSCTEFFLRQTPPEIPTILKSRNILNMRRYKPICQTYDNQRRFFTLYDIKSKIPVFSAYKYNGTINETKPKTPWMTEPQLEGKDNKNMDNGSCSHQACNYDYENVTGYVRVQLFPSDRAFSADDKISTFTLTNTVPQASSFRERWKGMEECSKCLLKEVCTNNSIPEGFVVTGAVLNKTNTFNNRVNIPTMLWSAFCCYSGKEGKWFAGAHWSISTGEKNRKYKTKTLDELYKQLGNHYKSNDGSKFQVFTENKCPLNERIRISQQIYFPSFQECLNNHCPYL